MFQIVNHAGCGLVLFEFQFVIGEGSAFLHRTIKSGMSAEAVVDGSVIGVGYAVFHGKHTVLNDIS